jgi:hypothetical protein
MSPPLAPQTQGMGSGGVRTPGPFNFTLDITLILNIAVRSTFKDGLEDVV